MKQRKHMQLMIEFAMYPDALVFVKAGTVNDTSFFVLVDNPLWEDDREYQVRTDMTLEEAQEDRKNTLQDMADAKEAIDLLSQY